MKDLAALVTGIVIVGLLACAIFLPAKFWLALTLIVLSPFALLAAYLLGAAALQGVAELYNWWWRQ